MHCVISRRRCLLVLVISSPQYSKYTPLTINLLKGNLGVQNLDTWIFNLLYGHHSTERERTSKFTGYGPTENLETWIEVCPDWHHPVQLATLDPMLFYSCLQIAACDCKHIKARLVEEVAVPLSDSVSCGGTLKSELHQLFLRCKSVDSS